MFPSNILACLKRALERAQKPHDTFIHLSVRAIIRKPTAVFYPLSHCRSHRHKLANEIILKLLKEKKNLKIRFVSSYS